MANTTISPNMSLPVPTVGEDPGPDWATNYNACMSAIDSHNHSAGQGVQIGTDGINILNDLAINNNSITNAKSYVFTPQSVAPSGLGFLYENGLELHYVDGSGNDVTLTSGGSPAGGAGTITGLPSGTASAAFAAGTFTFQQSTGVPAAMNVGNVTIGQQVASGFGVTISANVSQSSNYGLSLPTALPGSTKILTVDSSGNIGDSLYVDNSTIEVASSNLQVKDLGITTAKIADNAVGPVQTTIHYALSPGCGTYVTTNSGYTTITNCSASLQITSATNPVTVALIPDAGTTTETLVNLLGAGVGRIDIVRSGTIIATFTFAGASGDQIPLSLSVIDFPGLGVATYTARALSTSGGSFTIQDYRLYIRES